MKIAFVNQPLDMLIPPYQNSIGIWTYKVAPQIAKTHEVLVYGKRSSLQKSWNGQQNVRYHFVPPVIPNRVMLNYMGKLKSNDGLPLYASRLYYFDYAFQIAAHLRRQNVQIIHIHNFTQFVPIIRALNPKAKIVLHMNCEWLNQLDYDVMEQRIAQSDLVLGSSNYIAELARQRYPHYADRCQAIYNGVDADVFVAKEDNGVSALTDKRILFVGRVSPEKGIHDLIEAFCLVAEKYPEASLDIAGPTGSLPSEFIVGVSEDPLVQGLVRFYQEDYSVYLQRLIPDRLKDRVNFLGGMGQADLVKHYQNAAVLVNPSYSESFGMSLVEAMTTRIPVVATRAGGMVEITDNGRAGLLVDRGDVAALAAAILRVFADAQLRQELQQLGYERAQMLFSWPQVAQSLLDKYEKLFEIG
ncbi:MAG: glycosyltransferase family 4 protein [Chloroflexi bacterium]|nr:glycosyltransferase family 4 protein [Chloroflexota bacterium]